jgi:hypothetical protein
MSTSRKPKKPTVKTFKIPADGLKVGSQFAYEGASGTIVGLKINSNGTIEVSYMSTEPEGHLVSVVLTKDDLIPPTVPSDAVAATATLGPNVFTAVTPGVIGNSIALIFDGLLSVQAVTDSWNLEYADNQVSFTGDGLTIPLATTVTLSGGVDAVLAPESEDESVE